MMPDYGPGSRWYWVMFGGIGVFAVMLACWVVG